MTTTLPSYWSRQLSQAILLVARDINNQTIDADSITTVVQTIATIWGVDSHYVELEIKMQLQFEDSI